MPREIYPHAAAAHKAAALEITAMSAVVVTGQRQIHIALTALFLIRGHCVIATAAVPINKSSLIYGCANAGEAKREVHRGGRCAAAVPLIEQLARALGLSTLWWAAHACGCLSTPKCTWQATGDST